MIKCSSILCNNIMITLCYFRYYKFVPNLPEHLQPQCMRLHGLRACVIRALHYSYFTSLLQREVDNMSYLRQEEPHSLVKRKCILMWHKVSCE